MAYKQKTWWKSELAYLKGWLKYRKGLLISLGVIILLIGAFLYIMGRPYYIVNRNPITVNARITYIYIMLLENTVNQGIISICSIIMILYIMVKQRVGRIWYLEVLAIH